MSRKDNARAHVSEFDEENGESSSGGCAGKEVARESEQILILVMRH